jgi:hypothetical protein
VTAETPAEPPMFGEVYWRTSGGKGSYLLLNESHRRKIEEGAAAVAAAAIARLDTPGELADAMTKNVRLRKVVRKLLDLFSAPDDRRMRHADVTARTLDRYADEAGIFATRLSGAGAEHIAAELAEGGRS